MESIIIDANVFCRFQGKKEFYVQINKLSHNTFPDGFHHAYFAFLLICS